LNARLLKDVRPLGSAQPAPAAQGDPAEPRDDSDRSYDRPIGYLPAYELGRLHSGHSANLRSAKFGPSALDGDVPVYIEPQSAAQGDEPDYLATKIALECHANLLSGGRVEFDGAAWAAFKQRIAALSRQPSVPAIPEDCDVRKIMLRVVPGDGSGHEVYAKNVAEVEAVLSEMGARLEDFELAQGKPSAPASAGDDELPPLPKPVVQNWPSGAWSYHESQMRSYARAAVLADRQKRAQDGALLDWLRDNTCDLRCVNEPTDGDDYEVRWVVIEHHMAEPREREIARSYTDDPRDAIHAALAAARPEGEQHGE
jgi:hypothetical protein